jgi:DNA-directed RNA polymerase subunit beta'
LVRYDHKEVQEQEIPLTARLRVEEGQIIAPGVQITEGAKNPHQVLEIQGIDAVQQYLVEQVQEVYRSQGVSIHDKHIEIIARSMLRRVRITFSGDTDFLLGDLVDRLTLEDVNRKIIEKGGQPAIAKPILLGITKAALSTDSFLSASSFQHTINVLAQAAIEGKVDPLEGLKENVIIGKLIPAGTGYRAFEDESPEIHIRNKQAGEEEYELTLADLDGFDIADFDDYDDDDLDLDADDVEDDFEDEEEEERPAAASFLEDEEEEEDSDDDDEDADDFEADEDEDDDSMIDDLELPEPDLEESELGELELDDDVEEEETEEEEEAFGDEEAEPAGFDEE